jgi:deazaflavin-dependent oxidoreductase (nitroreductase family)
MRSGIVDRLQRSVINPLDRLAFRFRTPPPGDALVETIGRRTGQPRVTPVCDCLEGDTFWMIAQRGHSADYVRNIEANPRVRVKGSLSSSDWRAGTAHILDDDAEARIRTREPDRRGGSEDQRDHGPGGDHRVPGRELSGAAQLGRTRLPQPHLLQQGRQGRPLRRLGTAGPVHHRAPRRFPIASLDNRRRVHGRLSRAGWAGR